MSRSSGAEHHPVIGRPAGAREGARRVVLWVAVRVRASIFKEPGEVRRPALPLCAAVLVGLEDGAWIVAATGCLELSGALAVDVGSAGDRPALAGWAPGRAEFHGDVEPVDQ